MVYNDQVPETRSAPDCSGTTSDFDWLRDLCYYFNYIAAILILMSARLAPTELRRRRSPSLATALTPLSHRVLEGIK